MTDGEDAISTLPLLSDGTIWRVLERLLVLDGERLSYRNLDVEEIGSVYQAIMGFRIERKTRAGIGLAESRASRSRRHRRYRSPARRASGGQKKAAR